MVSTPSPPRPGRPPAEVTELASCTVGAPCWASMHGGGTLGQAVESDQRTALLYDPHGAVFGAESPRSSVIITAAVGLRPGSGSDPGGLTGTT